MNILRSLFGVRGTQQPLLDLEQAGRPMKRVYLLSEELKTDPEQVKHTRQLTLDKSRPNMGLKGSHGLFASSTWWNNINRRRMPLRFVSGVVTRAFEAGQDKHGVNNTVTLQLSDGTSESVGIYVNDPTDVRLFKAGVLVTIVYALDELKSSADTLGEKYSKVALEAAVSVELAA